jgi:flagellar protein FlbD
MLELTRLNGQPLFINGDLVKFAEAAPDTVLTLITGEKVVVRESCQEVRQRMLHARAEVLHCAWPSTTEAMDAGTAPAMEAAAAHNAFQVHKSQAAMEHE